MSQTLTMTETAHTFMCIAHSSQADKQGKPYHLHPERVGRAIAHFGEEYEAAGYLHDIVEDTWVTLEFLGALFPDSVIEAVDALTRREDEPYLEFVARAGRNPIAKVVKIADMLDNLRPGGKESLYKRYRAGLKLLGAIE